MLGKTTGIGGAIAGLVLCGLAAPAHAVILNFSGEITSCTPTCDSFAFLGTGSLLVGTIEFDDAALADGTWTGGDVLNLSFSVFDPSMPHHGPTNPPDPVADNPFTLDPTVDGGGLTVANGQPIMKSARDLAGLRTAQHGAWLRDHVTGDLQRHEPEWRSHGPVGHAGSACE
jgi:hypothetical protein